MSSLSATNVRARLRWFVDRVNEESEEITITGQYGNAVPVEDNEWHATQKTPS